MFLVLSKSCIGYLVHSDFLFFLRLRHPTFILNKSLKTLIIKRSSENLKILAKNPQESKRMGKNGNELLKTKYNQDLMYEKVMKMYNDVLSQG